MSKRTPGPWNWRGGYELDQQGTGDHILKANASVPISDANASLIAAAPELLEAARAAIKLLRACGFVDSTETMSKLKSAVAKAEGERDR